MFTESSPTTTLERISHTLHRPFHAPHFLSCHSSSFQECHNVNVLEWGRLPQAICHATNKGPSCIVIEREGKGGLIPPHPSTKEGI